MSRLNIVHTATGVLIFSLSYMPVIGEFTGLLVYAQEQNTTYNYAYDVNGNLTQISDSLGNSTNIYFDVLNRAFRKVQPVPQTGIARPTINYTVDGRDQPATVVDPRGLTTTYTSDGLGNQQMLASPDTGATNRTFDAAGNLRTSTDARGKVTTFTYDVLNRLTNVSYSTGTPTLLEYDGGPTGAPNALGHLTKMTDESGQTAYAYDQAGRLLAKTQTTINAVATVSRTINYAYGTNGKLLSLTYPSGSRLIYTYDLAGHVSNLTLNPPDGNGGTDSTTTIVLLDQINYVPFGAAQSWTWGNNSEQSPNHYVRTFDLDGRLVSYRLGSEGDAVAGMIRTVTYDAASRITAMTHTGNPSAAAYDQSFTYDGLGRLLTFTNSTGTQGYSYDASGNRTQFRVGANSYNNTISGSSNRLAATTGPVPAKNNVFDAAGNLKSDGTIAYSYSDRGRLMTAVNGTVTTNYLYNGLGQRTSKTGGVVPTGATEYAYDEQGRLLGEYDANGTTLQETVYLGNLPVVVLKQQAGVAAPAVYYVYADHINTPRIITDAVTNSVVWSWVLTDPFGLGQPNENPGGAGNFTYNARFPGQVFDGETNNHYNYFRDYDPQTGKYVESDPIGLSGGINTYAYAHGSPVSHTDMFGLRDVIVAIWTSRLADGSVGHVFMGEMDGTTLTSQFPTPHGTEGANTTKSWPDTVAAEGRDADYVYKVNVPNDGAFDAAIERVRRAPRWYAFPDGENSTQCAKAASGAMSAGGVKGIPSSGSIWPNWLNSDLLLDSVFGNQVTRLPRVPF